jgi:hypothetical protein
MTVSGEFAPIVIGRLVTKLPDKVPDRDIVFSGKAVGYGAGLEMERATGHWPLRLSIRYGRLWRYTAAQDVALNSLHIGASVALR